MESNEQTELTSKIETDLQMESRMTAMRGWATGWRDQQERKRTHGHGKQCGDCGGMRYNGDKW